MNSLTLAIISLILFGLGYKFYLGFLKKIFPFNPSRKTPAVEKYDGVDYVPAKNWLILFGHHFSSIAGAAPIIGPVIAVSIWGWFPSIIWILIGAILLGGAHDFGSLMASIRNDGNSIAEISEKVISRKAKILFSSFVWLALVLIIAVFVFFCAKTLVEKPEVVIPSLGLIPVAILVGILIYRFNMNFPLATVVGLSLLAFLIFLGGKFPISLAGNAVRNWSIILLIYCFFASITPVNILLQPRDYLSSFLLFAGIGIGFLGILLFHPKLNAPFFIGWGGKLGPLWPILFVTIACGAISGFHSLIASGTTSKQISNEKYAPRIGYGAMIFEGILATLALIVVSSLPFDKFSSIIKNSSPVSAFGIGYGKVTYPILGEYGAIFAVMILNGFILTTLDTATRISRYITQELFHIKQKYISTLIVVAFGGWLGISGKWASIWPIFGASNQLIAALALIVISAWLLSLKRKYLTTLIPAIFMLITTMGALLYKFIQFLRLKSYLLLGISLILLFLSIFLVVEVIKSFKKSK
jgi:carbon starvation protein